MPKRTWFPGLTLSFLAASWTPATLAQSCDCEVSEAKEALYDSLLNLEPGEKDEAIATHLPWGMPMAPTGATNETTLTQKDYLIHYDADLKAPLWVAYRLRAADLARNRERTECFRRDPRLPSENDASLCDDYEEPIFDRGHMVPNGDMERSEAAMINTYILSNIVPQHDNFNRKVWARLEGFVRDWTKSKGEVYVVTGAVFDRDDDGHRDDDASADRMNGTLGKRVAIPTHFYKIIVHHRPNGFLETMTILLPHVDSSPKGRQLKPFLAEHLTTIDAVEALTGIDYFPDLDEPKESAVERFRATGLWATE